MRKCLILTVIYISHTTVHAICDSNQNATNAMTCIDLNLFNNKWFSLMYDNVSFNFLTASLFEVSSKNSLKLSRSANTKSSVRNEINIRWSSRDGQLKHLCSSYRINYMYSDLSEDIYCMIISLRTDPCM